MLNFFFYKNYKIDNYFKEKIIQILKIFHLKYYLKFVKLKLNFNIRSIFSFVFIRIMKSNIEMFPSKKFYK